MQVPRIGLAEDDRAPSHTQDTGLEQTAANRIHQSRLTAAANVSRALPGDHVHIVQVIGEEPAHERTFQDRFAAGSAKQVEDALCQA